MASEKDAYIISYLDFRKAVGITALLLPVAVWTGGYFFEKIPMLDSVSAYYYTSMRDVFVGLLCAVGVFLCFYRGVKRWDTRLVVTLGAAVIFIALLPMDPTYAPIIHQRFPHFDAATCYVNHGPLKFHNWVSAVFFGLMSVIVFAGFPLTKELLITPQKQRRNLIYIACGVVMALCVATIVVQLKHDRSIFWPEAIAIGSFGFAWLIKGQQFLKDDESQRVIPMSGRNRWGFGKDSLRADSLEVV